jgi:hypothetical protein
MTTLLHRHGDVLAIVGARHYSLAPHLDDRPNQDRERRTVDTLCRLLIACDPAIPMLDTSLWPSPN